ncbi:MAG: TonB family protein [Sphingomonadales bacterium]|nr:TonB family protein [Sphingomonadales bacterium]
MYADRFAQPRKFSPSSLAIAVALNGALVAGLILSVPEFKKKVVTVLITTNIPIDQPPPPEPIPQPQPKIAQHPTAMPPIDRVVPLVDTPRPPTYALPPLPPVDPGIGNAVDRIIDPPAKPPVMIDPAIDQRYAREFQPAYPAGEQRLGNEGKVVIRVLVGTDGRVKQVERVSAPSEAFWQTTERQALSRWRFRPATRDGVPVEAWRTMTVRFEIAAS